MDLVTPASRTFGYDQAKYRMFRQTSHILVQDAMRNRYLYLQHMFSKLLLSFCKAAMQLIFSRDALTAALSCVSILKGVHLTFARENILLPIFQSFIFRGEESLVGYLKQECEFQYVCGWNDFQDPGNIFLPKALAPHTKVVICCLETRVLRQN